MKDGIPKKFSAVIPLEERSGICKKLKTCPRRRTGKEKILVHAYMESGYPSEAVKKTLQS